MYFQLEDNHDTTIAKKLHLRFKKLQVQTRVENYFSFNFYAEQRGLKCQGKNGGVSIHTQQLQEKI